MRIVPLMYVKEHHKLGLPVYDSDHRLLLNQGMPISAHNKEKLIDGGYMSVYVQDEFVEYIPQPIITDSLHNRCIVMIRNAFKDFKQLMEVENDFYVSNKVERVKRLKEKRDQHIEKLLNITEEVLDQIIRYREASVEYIDLKNMYNYPYQHALNTGIIAGMIGLKMDRNLNEIRAMFLSSIMCEMGNLTIPENILMKRSRLTFEEFDIVKEHCYKSFQQVRSCPEINYMVKKVCYEHHERVDGSGYPMGIKGDRINIMSKIVAVADAYDALTSDRTYRTAYPPHKALSHINEGSNILYDEKVVSVLEAIVNPFPIGTIVTLSTKDHAIVVGENKSNFRRPILKIIDEHASGAQIDLMKHPNIQITGIKYDI